MKKLKFELKEKAKRDCVYLHIMYAGGDADTEHPEKYLLKNIKYSEINNHLEEITKEVEKYKKLQEILEDHDMKCHGNYNKIEEKYGKEMAFLYDNTPNDPQSDYQFKCYVDDISIIAYDEIGDCYKSYV